MNYRDQIDDAVAEALEALDRGEPEEALRAAERAQAVLSDLLLLAQSRANYRASLLQKLTSAGGRLIEIVVRGPARVFPYLRPARVEQVHRFRREIERLVAKMVRRGLGRYDVSNLLEGALRDMRKLTPDPPRIGG